MLSPHEIIGYPAADGIFHGPVYWLEEQTAHQTAQGSPAEELETFEEAIESAMSDLRALSARSPEPAADFLEVQLAWLADSELVLPVKHRIRAGEAAVNAWLSEIAGHASAINPEACADIRDIEQRVLKLLTKGEQFAPPKGAVLAGSDISPTQFLETDWSDGGAILLEQGSALSHAAILARGRGVPMIVGVGLIDRQYRSALVDGGAGRCVLDPDKAYTSHSAIPSLKPAASRRSATTVRVPIELLLNINSLDELSSIQPERCDGIGLVRSEFLFRDKGAAPEEASQVAAYSAIVKWAKEKPVTVRLFDLGGDKPNFGLSVHADAKSMDSRGISVLLRNREVLVTQLRALLEASKFSDLRLLLPMVLAPEQLAEVRQLLLELLPPAMKCPPLGVMVETPWTARHPERFADADFFALGTNDLTQFMTGRSRNASGVSELSLAERGELFELIGNVISYGKKTEKAVCLCGDLASDLKNLGDLLNLGLQAISVPPFVAVDFAALRLGR